MPARPWLARTFLQSNLTPLYVLGGPDLPVTPIQPILQTDLHFYVSTQPYRLQHLWKMCYQYCLFFHTQRHLRKMCNQYCLRFSLMVAFADIVLTVMSPFFSNTAFTDNVLPAMSHFHRWRHLQIIHYQ